MQYRVRIKNRTTGEVVERWVEAPSAEDAQKTGLLAMFSDHGWSRAVAYPPQEPPRSADGRWDADPAD